MKSSDLSTHLTGGRVNVGLIQETMRKEFLNILQLCEGSKVTIWDEWLVGPIGLVAQYSLLQKHDVTNSYPLREGSLPPISADHIIFIARPKLQLMDLIADYILSLRGKGPPVPVPLQFHVVVAGRRSELCERQLRARGVWAHLSISEFTCDLFPVDSDVLSMELQDDFREYYVEGDASCLLATAHALRYLQRLYGVIPRVTGRGRAAKQVWELLTRLNKEEGGSPPGPSPACIDQLVLLERALDFPSLLVTQLTYEGLIDELFGIKNGFAQFPGRRFSAAEDGAPAAAAREPRRLPLNSADELYAELRDCNFTEVGGVLSRQARVIKAAFEERRGGGGGGGGQSVAALKQFVARLPQLVASKDALANHTAVAEYIKEVTDGFEFQDQTQCEEEFLNCVDVDKPSAYIEDLIAQRAPLVKVVRLMCLQSATGGGLRARVLDHYWRALAHAYGASVLPSLHRLQRAGLILPQQPQRAYAVLRKALNLTSETGDADSYLCSRYTPLSATLADHVARHRSLQGLQDWLGLLPAPSVEALQSRGEDGGGGGGGARTVLVVMVGGCTYAEMSALRALAARDDSVEFLLLTTKLTTGTQLLNTLLD